MFPNSANYFLNTPQQHEYAISGLNLQELTAFNLEIAAHLASKPDIPFVSELDGIACDLDLWIQELNQGDLINLTRWITERLAYLFHKQKMP